MATFRDVLKAVVDVGYVILQGEDDGQKEEYERRTYAIHVQIISDFGISCPNPESEVSPAVAGLMDRLVALLYQ